MNKQELTLLTDNLMSEIANYKIENEEQYQFVVEWIKKNKQTQKIIDEIFEPERVEKYKEYQEVLAEKKKYLLPLETTEKSVKKLMNLYYAEKQRIEQEKQRQQQLEMQRQIEEQRLNEAIETGDEEIIDAPIFIPKIEIPVVKEKGVSYVSDYSFEIVDFSAVPDTYKMIDTVKLNKVIKALKEAVNIPGIKVVENKSVRITA